MDEIKVRACAQFLNREAQGFFPERVQAFEITIEAGDAEQLQRDVEEMLLLPLGAVEQHCVPPDQSSENEDIRQRRYCQGERRIVPACLHAAQANPGERELQ